MNQTKQIKKKCSVVGHDNFVQLACFNEACKANRVYCLDCLQNGDHAAHLQDQKELKKFLEFCNSIAQESESLITKLLLEFGKINDSLTQLNLGLRKKYKLTNKGIFKLDAKQLNQVLDQFVKYNGFTKNLLQDIEKCSNDIANQLNKYTKELKLEEFNYYELTKQQREQAEQLYQQGYKLYQNDAKYKEAIQTFDNALLINPNHLLSLYTKADSLKMLKDYKEAIIWADKALSIDSNHLESLHAKGESLRLCGNYEQALKTLDQVLNIEPNYSQALASKGACLQELSSYQEAIICYNKAIIINPNYEWAKINRSECEKKLNAQKYTNDYNIGKQLQNYKK